LKDQFAYNVQSRAAKQINAAAEDPHVALVAIAFGRLRHVCRFEKGGYCKETKRIARLKFAPKSENKSYNPLYTN
jgi:hypothetical protein